jgi:hypothetical protein
MRLKMGKQVVAEIKCSPERWQKLDRKALFDYVREIGEIMRDFPDSADKSATVYDRGTYRPIALLDRGHSFVCKLDLSAEYKPLCDEDFQTWCAAPLHELVRV